MSLIFIIAAPSLFEKDATVLMTGFGICSILNLPECSMHWYFAPKKNKVNNYILF